MTALVVALVALASVVNLAFAAWNVRTARRNHRLALANEVIARNNETIARRVLVGARVT
jgi:hypothetical protein